MPKEQAPMPKDILGTQRPTDEDREYIIGITDEQYRRGGEDAMDPEELAGGLGPKGKTRAEAEKKRKMI